MEALHDVVKGRQGPLPRSLVDVGLAVLLQREEEREMFGLLEGQGVGSIPWSPLAKGRLARPRGTETTRTENDALGQRYVVDDDIPIVGPTTEHHLADAAAAGEIELTGEEIEPLEAPYTVRLSSGHE